MFETKYRVRTILAITAAAVLVVTSCAAGNTGATGAAPTGAPTAQSTSGAAQSSATADGSDLQGKTFTATQISGQQVADLGKITIGFTDGSIHANAGCNSLSGTATLTDGVIVAPQLVQTAMACEGVMDQENWLSDFISSAPNWTYADGSLVLTRGAVTLTLQESATGETGENAPLEGTRWKLSGITTGESTSSVPTGVDPAITIADGRIAFDAQCNSVGGEVVITDTTLDVTNVIGTLMACEDPRGAMEALLIKTISGTVNYLINGDILTIDGAEGTSLEFTVDADGMAQTPIASTDPGAVPTEKIENSIPQIPEDKTVTQQADQPATIDPALAGLSFTTPIPNAPNGEVITLSFSERILTNASCNSIRSQGAQSTEGGVLTVGNLLSSRMFCEGLSDAENAWMDFLQSKPTWTLDGPTLTLTSVGTTYSLTSTP